MLLNAIELEAFAQSMRLPHVRCFLEDALKIMFFGQGEEANSAENNDLRKDLYSIPKSYSIPNAGKAYSYP